jgi:hypothetical protein
MPVFSVTPGCIWYRAAAPDEAGGRRTGYANEKLFCAPPRRPHVRPIPLHNDRSAAAALLAPQAWRHVEKGGNNALMLTPAASDMKLGRTSPDGRLNFKY